MILYKGRMFSNEKSISFAKEIESCYDNGTLMFLNKDSLDCYLTIEGEVCSNNFTCSDISEKEELMSYAEENRVSISWLD